MNTRRPLVRLGLASGLLIAIILGAYAASLTVPSSPSSTLSKSQSITTASATGQLVADNGPIITLDQARLALGLGFALPPAPLPDGLTLLEIRGVPNYIALVYVSSGFQALPNFDKGNMIIFIAKDNTTYVPASAYASAGGALMSCDNSKPPVCITISQTTASARQTTIANVTVSGHPGISFYPQGQQGFGSLTWWSNGVHYTIIANLPLTELMKIAESMKT